MNSAPNGFADLIALESSGAAPWEVVPASEHEAIAAITADIEARVREAARQAPARRDAHPKGHGCTEAELRVLDNLPTEFQVGLFARPRVYQAWVRYSNGSPKPQADAIGDARGMAVKVMDVKGSRSGTQDFVAINQPAFFVRSAADYVAFVRAENPLRFFFPSFNPFTFRLHELFAARAVTRQIVSNPLNIRYWSMTPYLFGDLPCKFSFRPVGALAHFEDRSTPNFLHGNLARSLAGGEAAFDLCIQRRVAAASMPVEDSTILWQETDSPFVPVARLTIRQQDIEAPGRREFCENLSFTPWHGLDAHRPLGCINRVRRVAYETISRVRHELNNVPRTEPTSLPRA